MKRHTSNSSDSGKRYRWFLTCFLASVVLLFLAMSGRALAANIVVDSLTDDDVGCTLREAIDSANGDADDGGCVGIGAYGADTITFSVAGTIMLDSALPNITDTDGLTIDGASQITISGDNAGALTDRVFIVDPTGVLTLQNLTVINGTTDFNGGGIFNQGTVTITNSTFSGNSADDDGGGIFNDGGSVTITNSIFSGNSAEGVGGGIFNDDGGTVTIWNSTFSGNSADTGGGIINFGTLTVTNSTFSVNSAVNSGGGISSDSGDQEFTITNSTFSGNSANNGGGILNSFDSPVTIINSTLSGNSAVNSGGGISNDGILTITNSIVANSPLGGDCDQNQNFGSFTANGHNLDTDGSCQSFSPNFATVSSAQLNLGPLFFNGGPTKTHALQSGSFAINNGVQALCESDGITEDQRGETRDGACDIGAYEFIAPPPPPQADLSISNSAAKTKKSGLIYTINVTNNGPNTAADVVVNDIVATGTGFVSVNAPGAISCSTPAPLATGTVSCFYGSLANGDSIPTMTVNVKVTAKGNAQLNNTASVSSTTDDPNLVNNSATATSKLGKK